MPNPLLSLDPLVRANYTMVVGAALAGQGVAIGWQHRVDAWLAQGLLCRPAASRAFAQWLWTEVPEADRPALDSNHG